MIAAPFAPIAIVGRACVLPGALTPEALWALVRDGRTAISAAPAGRWGIARERMLAAPNGDLGDRAVCDAGGYVDGFVFDPSGFALDADQLTGLDPVFSWVLHAGRTALRDARFAGDRSRAGAVIGNLSYPSSSLARLAERTWLAAQPPPFPADDVLARIGARTVDPRNRFMSGLPAHLLARALGLGGGAFALDAACASSLYAIKLACDALHDGRADLMLAGAVNCADDLFLHAGFTALGALSPTGRSQPFGAGADGLVPAEGAVIVALRRLDDAVRDGDRIHGVIRGIGLSNDGRARGLLAPAEDGQLRALTAAYHSAGVVPAEISLLECHATGTVIGDAVEIAALTRMFAGRRDALPIGSLKANVGHLITAAGGAALLKVLGAFDAAMLPATPGDGPLTGALDGAPLRVLRAAEPWRTGGARLAAISAFGFGGNNAHMIVEEPPAPRRRQPGGVRAAPVHAPAPEIAIVALAARVADGGSAADFATALFTGGSRVQGGAAPAAEIAIELAGLKFPPHDLEDALPQQLLVFATARDAVRELALPADRTGVFIGMQCDPEIARHGARWRSAEWSAALGAGEPWTAGARDGFVPLLGAAGVVGAMPNIVANRLSSQLDLHGPSIAISSEQLSGITALLLARRALAYGELDAAIVGAVDLSVEAVHMAAARAVGCTSPPGDAAVVLVVKRLADARRDGDRVLAVLDEPGQGAAALGFGDGGYDLAPLVGDAHCARGLLHVAAAVLCCAHRALPARAGSPATVAAWHAERRRARVQITALGGEAATVWLAESLDPPRGPLATVLSHRDFLAALAGEARLPVPPVLAFPAHRRSPQLPVPPTQRMAPAPSLPLGWPTVASPPPSPRLAIAAHQLAHRRQVAAVHHGHLALQGALHNQFLAGRAQAIQQLWAAIPRRTSISAPIPTSIMPRSFTRQQLEHHASGAISELFGPAFIAQDSHAIQVRMPEPPLLLADRVTAIDAEPGSMQLGTVWTETDVRADSWYLHCGVMPAGILIEAGQADLFLISYLGIDLITRGQRAYRLLGCELTYHAGLPRAGETLRYEIRIDSHARQGDIRLFFFHYDCWVVRTSGATELLLSVRHGQAGFFTRDELDGSAGVIWSAGEAPPPARVDPPAVVCTARQFSSAAVAAFAAGDLRGCFGAGFEYAATHVRSPSIAGDRMRLIDRVDDFDPAGGPWRRGYLRAATAIHADDWFFAGHFKNDPCMPGTLMFEGCLQTMAFYLAGLGYTLPRDGWRFEPVLDHGYRLQCRGEVLPSARELVCELFVEEVHAGPLPTVFGDLLGSVDGKKAFHARRVGLRLVPDWPTSSLAAPPDPDPARPVAHAGEFRLDHASLIACAWGRPSDAFGPIYARFDSPRRVARLPGPPYHFMSRVTEIEGELGRLAAGARATIEYDLPAGAWYFADNGNPAMPFCVLVETALQPCGWLGSYAGSALASDDDLVFRNLDGNGRVLAEVPPGTRTLRTTVTLLSVARSSGMVIESFAVRCSAGDQLICELDTSFGFFPPQALAQQLGLPTSDEQRALHDAPSNLHIDLTGSPTRYFAGPARIATGSLRMLDCVTAYDPRGGRAGLGSMRAEKAVDPADWFFRAHFFQDPVQPGSLGVEAMLQLLQLFMLHTGLAEPMQRPRFQPIASGRPVSWKYRGQVLPAHQRITITLEITEITRGAGSITAVGDASLWIDGLRIHTASQLAMTLVDEPALGSREQRTPRELLPEVLAFWRGWSGVTAPIVADVYRALLGRFTRTLAIDEPAAVRAACRHGALLLANHQTSIESTSLALIASALAEQPILTLAKTENRDYWLTRAMQHMFGYPGMRAIEMIEAFDRADPASLSELQRALAKTLAGGRSIMVHVEGTRAVSCRVPVERMSGTFVDLALATGRPIIPVRFTGGLPAEPAPARLDFPLAMGRQDIWLGRPISPDELAPLGYLERSQRVLAAINGLGPPSSDEQPLCPDPAFEASVARWQSRTGAALGYAALYCALAELADPSPATAAIVRAADTHALVVPATDEGRWMAALAASLYGPRGPRITLAGNPR